jgi:hypothetical protein
MDTYLDPEHLAKRHAESRRGWNRLYIAMALFYGVSGTIAWAFTQNIVYLFAGLFMAVFPLIYLFYNHFILFNPRQDPLETYRRLKARRQKRQQDKRTTALVNGSMLLIVSPLFIAIAVENRAEHGIGGVVAGGFISLMSLVSGLLMIAWWRRSRR